MKTSSLVTGEFTLYKHSPALQCFLLAAQHIRPWPVAAVSTSVWPEACWQTPHLETNDSHSEGPMFNPQSHFSVNRSKPFPLENLGFWNETSILPTVLFW